MRDATKSEVISVRVRKGLKAMAQKKGVDIAKVIEGYLENVEREERAKETMKRLRLLVEKRVKPSKAGFAVASVREDRYEGH